MSLTALEVRSHFAMAVVTRFIYGNEIGEEKEADVYFEAFELDLQSFALGDPTLPFLFRDVAFLTRAWKDGFATGYENSILQSTQKVAEQMNAASLHSILMQKSVYDLDGFHLSADEHGVWVTNPYGVDCMLLPMTIGGCEQALALVAKTKDRKREWAFV